MGPYSLLATNQHWMKYARVPVFGIALTRGMRERRTGMNGRRGICSRCDLLDAIPARPYNYRPIQKD